MAQKPADVCGRIDSGGHGDGDDAEYEESPDADEDTKKKKTPLTL